MVENPQDGTLSSSPFCSLECPSLVETHSEFFGGEQMYGTWSFVVCLNVSFTVVMTLCGTDSD